MAQSIPSVPIPPRHLSCLDLVTVFNAILTSRQTCEELQCLYENLMSHNFRKTAFLKKRSYCKKKITNNSNYTILVLSWGGAFAHCFKPNRGVLYELLSPTVGHF